MSHTARIETPRPSPVSSLPAVRPYTIPDGARKWIDAMRALAAFAVFAGHLRNIFFVDFTSVQNPTLLVKALYFFTGFGQDAVILFFVLSGLLVGSSIYRSMTSGTWRYRHYLVQRFIRLEVVLIPALILGFAWDYIGLKYLGDSKIYAAQVGNILRMPAMEYSSLKYYLSNAFFLQVYLTPTAGTNAALWSLSYEFWSYLCFPAVLYVMATHTTLTKRLLALTLLTLVQIEVGSHFNTLFFVWIMGACVAQQLARPISATGIRRYLIPTIGWLTLFGALGFFRVFGHAIAAQTSSLIVGISAAFALIGLLYSATREVRPPSFLAKVAETAAGFSFTLYLCHLPPLFFLGAAFGDSNRWQPDPKHLVFGAGVMLLVLVYAYAVSRLTEAHTERVRSWVMNLLFRR